MKIKIVPTLLILLLFTAITTAYSTEKKRGVELTILDKSKISWSKRSVGSFFGKSPVATSWRDNYPGPKMPILKDTIDINVFDIDYTREFIEKINERGDIDISFDLFNHGEYLKNTNFIFYDSAMVNYDSRTDFIADWYIPFHRRTKQYYSEPSVVKIYIVKDTIYTINSADPTGGVTPEGHSFRFSGEEIKRVSGRSKAIFSIEQIFDLKGRDDWTISLCSLETPWEDYFIDSLSYSLPVLKDVTLSKESFKRIKERALAVQKRYLIDSRDSVVAIYGSYGDSGKAYINEILENLKRRLKPNLDDAHTPNELYLLIELSYFVNELTVYYKDGTSKKIYHFAGYDVSVP